MECELCQTPGRIKFYCEACLNERLLIHKNALQRLRASLDTRIQNASENLQAPDGVWERKNLKAKRDSLISNIKNLEFKQITTKEKSQINQNILEKKRKELNNKKIKLNQVKLNLEKQKFNIQKPNDYSLKLNTNKINFNLISKIILIQKNWDEILQELSIIRKKLIIQVYSIYTITANYTTNQHIDKLINSNQNLQSQSQKQPSHYQEQDYTSKLSSVDKINQRVSWKILGLSLPVSTDIKSFHHEQISAATLYTSHLVRLIALYLGIKLPFQMIMGPALSIRAPINSIWNHKHPSPYPLHISSSMLYSTGSQVSQVAFLTGLCMLSINVHYLLITQQIEIINNNNNNQIKNFNNIKIEKEENKNNKILNFEFKPTELLRNLFTLSSIHTIGIQSHLTGKKLLFRPDDVNNNLYLFNLEDLIKQVLQSKIDDSVDEGWSII